MTDNWTEEELKAAVAAYIDMHEKEANGISFVKKHYYTDLAKQFGRTEKSYEYRMQNISYVFSLMGRKWVSGLKPAKNVGARIAEVIEHLISKTEGQTHPKIASFETQVISYKHKKTLEKPEGIKKPEKSASSVTTYSRDPKVKAWVLKESLGHCECCENPAPFVTPYGEPFLEVHHLRSLADGGSDTITNSVALCPNCHRGIHYGANKADIAKSMYKKVSRLIHE